MIYLKWKTWTSKLLLLTTLVTQTSLIGLMTAPSTAYAADGLPVVINEVSPAGDWIELFASRDVNFGDSEGWTLVTANGVSVALSGSMTPGQYKTFTFAAAPLGILNGSVKLTHGNTDADIITWGNERGSQVPGVVGDNSIARSDDGSGRWISNVIATQSASNKSAMTGLPPLPSTVKVPATSGSAVNVINSQNQGNVTIQAGYSGTATLNAAIGDAKGNNTAVSSSAGDTMDGGSLTGIDASTLSDGPVYVRSYTDSSGKRSAWTTLTALKDTVAPSTPAPLVLAQAKNGQNVINSNNAADVRVSIGTPGSDSSSITATLTDSAATSVSGSLPLDGSRGLNAQALVDGTVVLTVTVTDTAGNTSAVGLNSSIGKDTSAPAAVTDLRGTSANGFVSLSWTASATSDTGSYRIYADQTKGSFDSNSPLAEVSASTVTFTTNEMPNGDNAFRVNTVDRLGNEELTGSTKSVTVSGPLNERTLTSTNRTLNLLDPLKLWLNINSGTVNSANVTVRSNSLSNPTTANLPSGHVSVGTYFDLGTNNKTVFPMEVRLYYTEADLAAAGVLNDKILEGIRYYDAGSKTWQLYSSTGVRTADVTEGSLRFAGYVWAMTDHLTPVVISADTIAPNKPTGLLATAGDSLVKLRWDRISDTAGYMLRYRQATNDDTVAYQTVFVNGGDVTTATLKGFENGVLYEFGVASLDWVGNQSHYAVVEQTPVSAGTSADFVVPSQSASQPAPSSSSVLSSSTSDSTDSTVAVGSTTSDSTPGDTSAIGGSVDGTDSATTPTTDDSSDQNSDNADETTATATQDAKSSNSRTLVTILIIVIAAAAGFGGYYGYQWWMTKPETTTYEENTQEEEPKKKPEKTNGDDNDRNGRW